MPVKITALNGGKYRVSTPDGVKAKRTSKKRADRLKRLLIALDHGWSPNR